MDLERGLDRSDRGLSARLHLHRPLVRVARLDEHVREPRERVELGCCAFSECEVESGAIREAQRLESRPLVLELSSVPEGKEQAERNGEGAGERRREYQRRLMALREDIASCEARVCFSCRRVIEGSSPSTSTGLD